MSTNLAERANQVSRRPFPVRTSGIGIWDQVITVLTYISVFNTIGLMVMQVDQVCEYIPLLWRLTDYLGKGNSDVLHTLLGDVYSLSSDYSQAIVHYNMASRYVFIYIYICMCVCNNTHNYKYKHNYNHKHYIVLTLGQAIVHYNMTARYVFIYIYIYICVCV